MLKSIFIVFLFLSSSLFSQFRGGEPVSIAGGDGNVFLNPRWSPDGKYIAVTGSNYKGLWIINTESDNISLLTGDDAAGYGYQWSGDSKSILTRSAKFDEYKRYNAVKLFDVETKNSKALSDYSTSMPEMPQWSSDNSSIYFFNNGKLETYRTGKNTLSKSTAQRKEIFLKGDRIITGDPNKNELIEIDPVKAERYLNLRISPDRTKAVFEAYGGDLYVMDIDGKNLTDLGKGYRACWSPDSKYIVYMITEDDGHQYISSDLYISDAKGETKQQLTFTNDVLEMDPDWSPDGTKIIYDDNLSGAVYSISLIKSEEEK